MAEMIKVTRLEDTTPQRPDRPRYEPPMVVHLGNSQRGRGNGLCTGGSGAPHGCDSGMGPED